MNDKKKNDEMKPENLKKVPKIMNNDEVTDFDEIRKDESAQKSDSRNSDIEGSIKDSKTTDDGKDNTVNTKSAKNEIDKEKGKSERKSKKINEKELKTEKEKSAPSDQKSEKIEKEDANETSGKSDESEKNNKKAEKKSHSETVTKKNDDTNQEPVQNESKDKEEVSKKDFQRKEETDHSNLSSESSEKKEETKENTKKDTKEKADTNKAISQSKKIADAKAAMETITTVSNAENRKKELNTKEKKTKKKNILGITLGTVAGVLLVVYVAGFIYFSGHFYHSVAINGIDVSDMNQENAKQTLDNFYKNYVLTLETIDGTQIPIDGKDISMQITLRDEFSSCFKQQKTYLWFINMFRHYDFNVGADTSWNQSALFDLFNSMKILNKKNMTAPKDAYVGVKNGKFAIIQEVMGNTIDVNKFKQTVENSLTNVMSILVLKDEDCYDLPEIYSTSENLKKDLEAKNAFADNEIKLQLDDLTLEPGMELYDAVLEKRTDTYEVSKKQVEKYVQSLAKKYDTLGKDRNFTTSFDDKEIKISGTAFGYEMNQEETATALYEALKAGKSATVEVVFNEKGYTLKGENDIGDTYIEVNLSEQKVFAYKNGEQIAEGDCVSGNESAGHGTCTGLYAIQNKLSPTVLRGEKKPVTKTTTKKKKNGKKVKVTTTTYEYEYESPVTFWMQFNGGIGLHDAAGWRSSYGGSIYYYNGSHGCVNLPYSLAETLYNNFNIGDPVIVYFWDNENRQ